MHPGCRLELDARHAGSAPPGKRKRGARRRAGPLPWSGATSGVGALAVLVGVEALALLVLRQPQAHQQVGDLVGNERRDG